MKSVILILFISLITVFASDDSLVASIYQDDTQTSGLRIDLDIFDEETALAAAKYNKSMLLIGWDQLLIKTNKKFDDLNVTYAAGYLEGYITAEAINDFYQNMVSNTWGNGGKMPENAVEFLKDNKIYIENQYKQNPKDNYWNLEYSIQRQFDGLYDGFISTGIRKIEIEQFHTMSSFGDLFDITSYKNYQQDVISKLTPKQLENYIASRGHCSVLIKINEDFSDIFFGHTSWFTYTATNRIFKQYIFDLNNPLVKTKEIKMSSYPAVLASNDDFYITSSDLAVFETTNNIFNSELYASLTPNSLLCWHRAMLANRIANNSVEWTETFAKHNSGTYNNQFIVLDLKQIDLVNQKINENALRIIEQIPGYTESNDVTANLNLYWPSYNIPFSSTISRLSGYDALKTQEPDQRQFISYDNTPRANIFRRDQHTVHTLEDYMKIIRYNNYLNDPLSLGDPGHAIASRFDLETSQPSCMGAYDAKISSKLNIQDGKIFIKAGPTSDGVPRFKFSNSSACNGYSKEGLPDEYNFDWYEFTTLEEEK